jgi:four helix bundle protein
MAGSFKDLIAWQKARRFVPEIYRVTRDFPSSELYGLTGQLKRAAMSVPSNIAEGQARHYKPDFKRFLRNAKGSLAEMETQLIIACDLGFLSGVELQKLTQQLDEISRIVAGLIARLNEEGKT